MLSESPLSAALKLPICTRRFPRDIGKERPCLNFHIGKCDGFCSPGGPGQAEYHARMTQAAELLGGKLRQVTAALRQDMESAAEALEFEKAAALRDRLQALQVLGKQQQVIAGVCADTDVWGVYIGPVRCGAAVLHIENGDLLGRQIEIFPTAADQAESEVLSAVLSQYYLDKAVLPREILLPCLFDGSETFAALLTGQAGHKVTVKAPQRGERSQLVDMAAQNAKEEVERITTESERLSRTLTDLHLAALLGISVVTLTIAALVSSKTSLANMAPWWGFHKSDAIAPWAYVGFDTIPQAAEEFKFSYKKVS